MNEAPQQRGYAFERFLKCWFDLWGLVAHASFRTVSEQIDGSFQHEGNTYLGEAKWKRMGSRDAAYDMEQSVIELLAKKRKGFERVHCSQSEIESAWQQAFVDVIRGK
ncbi:hypothetical protein ACA106_07250 [Agrobacterium pusense]|uniref:hypothetical protein n=1 Tax=Agrobacterium pusense TaxID=648995 RepID=UPI0035A63324